MTLAYRLASYRLSGVIVVVGGALLGATRVTDSDVWTHLAHGRAIVAARGLPAHEPFTYPSAAMPYYNTEWLFGVGLYLAHAAGGITALIGVKAALFALTAWFLWRGATLAPAGSADHALRSLVGVAVVLAALLAMRYRVVERPDLALMVFLAATTYAVDAFVTDGRRRALYALIPLAALWSNVHPSVIVAAAPFAAVLTGGLALRAIARWRGGETSRTPSAARLRVVAVVGAAAAVATLANPYGWDPLTLPFRLAGSDWFRHEIGELQAPRLIDHPISFALGALVLVTLLVRVREAPLISTLLVLPFAWLALSATRFVFLLPLVVAAPLARALTGLLSNPRAQIWRRVGVGTASVAAACLVVATALAVANVGPLTEKTRQPGLGIDARAVPEGALAYLDRIGASGRIFNAFHFGGYVAWRDFPRRAPIVDGRGWLPAGLIEEIHFARVYPEHLGRLQAAYGFEVAVMDYASFSGEPLEDVIPGADAGLASSAWALVYWDDVALVYLRRAGALAPIIAREEYRYVRPANGPAALGRLLQAGLPVDAVQDELRRNARETGSTLSRTLEGVVALHLRDWDRALEVFRSVQDGRAHLYALQGAAVAAGAKRDLSVAITAYDRLLAETDDPRMLMYAGVVALSAGRERAGIDYLERARRRDPALESLYPPLVEAYRRRGDARAVADVTTAHLRAQALMRARDHAARGRRLLHEGRADPAVSAFQAALGLNPNDAHAWSGLGDGYAALGRLDEAAAAQRAALVLDPKLASAHYGLGLLDERRGALADARRHFTEFVRLEPRSYAAWRVRDRLAGVP